MRSFAPVIGLERQEDWERHLKGVLARLKPEDELEALLAERIAQLLWRLTRVLVFETHSIEVGLAKITNEWEAHHRFSLQLATLPTYADAADRTPEQVWVTRRQAEKRLPDEKVLDRVMRYEAHLQRQLVRMLQELEAVQARRVAGG